MPYELLIITSFQLPIEGCIKQKANVQTQSLLRPNRLIKLLTLNLQRLLSAP